MPRCASFRAQQTNPPMWAAVIWVLAVAARASQTDEMLQAIFLAQANDDATCFDEGSLAAVAYAARRQAELEEQRSYYTAVAETASQINEVLLRFAQRGLAGCELDVYAHEHAPQVIIEYVFCNDTNLKTIGYNLCADTNVHRVEINDAMRVALSREAFVHNFADSISKRLWCDTKISVAFADTRMSFGVAWLDDPPPAI